MKIASAEAAAVRDAIAMVSEGVVVSAETAVTAAIAAIAAIVVTEGRVGAAAIEHPRSRGFRAR